MVPSLQPDQSAPVDQSAPDYLPGPVVPVDRSVPAVPVGRPIPAVPVPPEHPVLDLLPAPRVARLARLDRVVPVVPMALYLPAVPPEPVRQSHRTLRPMPSPQRLPASAKWLRPIPGHTSFAVSPAIPADHGDPAPPALSFFSISSCWTTASKPAQRHVSTFRAESGIVARIQIEMGG